jgi:hypothetical protein
MEPLLAHQGGWDEFLVLLSPVVLFTILRVLERRRRPSVEVADPSEPAEPPSESGA